MLSLLHTASPRRKSFVTAHFLALTSVIVLVAGACSTSATPTESPMVTVPALWAGENADGQLVGGIEQATVQVSPGSGAFTLDLNQIADKGAGDRWTAATTVAAMVATLFSGRDPRTINLDYSVSGPIDGTSAGAVLTVGSLAAINQVPLLPRITMTGTISSDGTVGTVEGVPTKVKAAADAGYDTVLLPVGSVLQEDPGTGVPRDMTSYGESLGVTVRPVGDLAEAYRIFTGQPLAPPVGDQQPPLSPGGTAVAQRTTEALAERTTNRFAAVADRLPPAVSRAIAGQVRRVNAAVDRRDWATAYGLGVDTYQNVERAAARRTMATALRRTDRQQVADRLRRTVKTLIADADTLLRRDTDAQRLGVEQVFSLPFAAGWYTYARAALQTLADQLRGPRAPSAAWLRAAAPIMSDQRAALAVFGPDAVASARRAPAMPVRDPEGMTSFVAAYADFLARAGDANMAYFDTTSVFGASGEAADPATVAQALKKEMAAASGQSGLSEAMADLAHTTSYYILSQTAVSGPSFGLSGFGIGSDPTADSAGDPLGLGPAPPVRPRRVLTHSVASGAEQARARSLALVLEPNRIQPDYAIWQTRWGGAVYGALQNTPRRGAGGALALNEIWYAVIGALMQQSAQAVGLDR